MKTYTKKELEVILDNHALWLKDDPKGVKANLSGANLSEANLPLANLCHANLSNANLYNVKGIMTFNLNKHQGVAWKHNDKVIVKIGRKELSLEEWLKDGKNIGNDYDCTDLDIKLYLEQLKTIKKVYKWLK